MLTGIPVSGALGPGDEVELLRGDGSVTRSRVRGLQAYGQPVDRVRAGHSSALNLPDVERAGAARGDVVAAPGLFAAATLWEAHVTHLPSRRRPLGAREQVRVHTGTAEVLGELVLLDRPALAPGEEGLAQLRLAAGLVAGAGDRAVLRRHSPLETLGGATLLGPSRHRLKAGKARVVEAVGRRRAALADPALAVAVALDAAEAEGAPARALDVARALGRGRDEVAALLARLARDGDVVPEAVGAAEPVWRTRAGAAARAARRDADDAAVLAALAAWHADRPARQACPAAALREATGLPAAGLAAATERLAAAGRVEAWTAPEAARRLAPSGWALAGHTARPSAAQAALAEALTARYRGVVQAPPALAAALAEAAAACPAARDLDARAAEDVAAHLAERGALAALGGDDDVVVLDAEAVRALGARAREVLRARGPLPAGTLRDAMGASRRVAVAVLEHLDTLGVTRRAGDARALREETP